MHPVGYNILSLPNQAVALSRRSAVGPQIRSPEQNRCLNAAALSVEVQGFATRYLVLNQPASRKRRLIRIWLGVEPPNRVPAVGPATQIHNPKVREARPRIVNHGDSVPLKLPPMLLKIA